MIVSRPPPLKKESCLIIALQLKKKGDPIFILTAKNHLIIRQMNA